MTKNDILHKLKELKPVLYKDYSVKEIGLFGSFSDDSYMAGGLFCHHFK